jgi:hypothetical protein
MMSAAAMVSILASASVLPCSMVNSGAMLSARSRIRFAALRMILQRSKAETARHTLKPWAAAASASSRSERSAWATVPMVSSVAGFTTAMDLPERPGRHLPLMNNAVSG